MRVETNVSKTLFSRSEKSGGFGFGYINRGLRLPEFARSAAASVFKCRRS